MTTIDFVTKHKHEFCFIGCTIGVKVKDGEIKKDVIWQKKWSDANLENWEDELHKNGEWCNDFGVKTGKVSGITVIDFDDAESYFDFCQDVPDFKDYFTVKSRKGCHVYCKYDPRLINTTDVLKDFKGVDIRNDGGVILCPPSSYTLPDGTVINYEFLGGEIREIPEFLLENIKPEKLRSEPIQEIAPTTSGIVPTDKILIKVVNALPIECIDDYDTWSRIGMIYFNENYSVEDWAEIGKRCHLHDRSLDRCKEHWKSFNANRNSKIKAASLWRLLKIKNIDEFWKLNEETKPPKPEKEIKEPSKKCILDDYHGCQLLKENYKNNIIKCGDTWYVNMPGFNHWERGEEFVRELIMISHFTKKKGEIEIPYSSNTSGCNNIFKAVCSSSLFPLNENFIDEINRKTKARLYFQDKYWDFVQKKWHPTGQETDENGPAPIIPLIYIKRKAPSLVFTPEEIAEYKTSVLNMFATDADRNLYLQGLARGLAGHYEDKKFLVMKGLRNSGKGVLQEQCLTSFGEYCCIYDVPMTKTNYKADASDRRWVLTSKAHIKRIGFTSEVANIVGKNDLTIDGNELKKVICSGGDSFKARGHYSDEIDVIMNTTTIMSLNNIPVSNPTDALENMIPFSMPFKFVDEDMVSEDIMYRKADSTIKDNIKKNTKWRDIFLHLIFEAYQTTPIKFSDMNEINQAETMHVNKDTTNPVKLFNDAFVKDEFGWVSTEDIRQVLAKAKLNDCNLSKFLKDRGFIQKKATVPKLNEYGLPMKDDKGKEIKVRTPGYAGLSLKQNNDESEEITEE